MALRGREKFKMETIFEWEEERREMVKHFNEKGTRNGIKLYWSSFEVNHRDCKKRNERIIIGRLLEDWKLDEGRTWTVRTRKLDCRFLEMNQEDWEERNEITGKFELAKEK